MKVAFVSLISRDGRPLYIYNNGEREEDGKGKGEGEGIENFLKYNFLSHMSLDVFESTYAPNTSEKPGLLFVQDGVFIYGYEMSIGVKVVVGIIRDKITLEEWNEKDLTELDYVKNIIDGVCKEFVRYSCSSFREGPIEEINSNIFDKRISKVINI